MGCYLECILSIIFSTSEAIMMETKNTFLVLLFHDVVIVVVVVVVDVVVVCLFVCLFNCSFILHYSVCKNNFSPLTTVFHNVMIIA